MKPRLKDLISAGKVHLGEHIFTKKQPQRTTIIIDGDTVEYQGEILLLASHVGWLTICLSCLRGEVGSMLFPGRRSRTICLEKAATICPRIPVSRPRAFCSPVSLLIDI